MFFFKFFKVSLHLIQNMFFSLFKSENWRDTIKNIFKIFFTSKTIINHQKRPKWRFWHSITFFCAFSKMPIKRTFVRLLFLKLNQSRNTKKSFFGGFSLKTKNTFFRGSKIVVFKAQISNLFFCVCYLM